MADEPVCPWQIDLKGPCPVHGARLELCPVVDNEAANTIQHLISALYKKINR